MKIETNKHYFNNLMIFHVFFNFKLTFLSYSCDQILLIKLGNRNTSTYNYFY